MVLNPISLQTTLPIGTDTAFAHEPDHAARPFVKWVGGKAQLLNQIDNYLPGQLKERKLSTYIEPFLGGGAMFFHVAQNYELSRFIVSDSNKDLILSYWIVRERVGELILALHDYQSRYLKLSEQKREEFYYKVRTQFNKRKLELDVTRFSEDWILHTTQLLFLNKTCFNGLFRVNSSGLFNVAFGKYDQPRICDPNNLVKVAELLKRADIFLCDFDQIAKHITGDSLVYLDPPYRPLTETANFTGYSAENFTALDQQRLARFCRAADKKGAKVLLSNSDPTNVTAEDTYFETTYPNFRIVRTEANRMVNCRADKRGKISELLIMNYGDG